MLNLIVATDSEKGIGKDNNLPWHDSEELAIFKQKTENSILIMGRKTVESLPLLKNRTIFCITRHFNDVKSNNVITIFSNVDDAIQTAINCNKTIFIAGGKEIYEFAINRYPIYMIHISEFKCSYNCDTNVELNFNNYNIVNKQCFDNFHHTTLKMTDKGEYQYLDLLKFIINNGTKRLGRNGYTLSVFGKHFKFDLRNGFPLLTTKKMFIKGIVEELLFFIRGDTDSKILENKKVNIWKGNTSREYLDSLGFNKRECGIMGPLYGYQWRYFNAEYDDVNGKPKEQGIDQLENIINLIKTDPTSRRIIMTDYNPLQVSQGVLPPCHSIVLQFYVSDGYLDMFCFNRSQDLFLGTPFNIASSALLLCIISKITKLTPRFLHMSLGDVHVYEQHVDCAILQTTRNPFKFPSIALPNINCLNDINALSSVDFIINNYLSHDLIKANMVV